MLLESACPTGWVEYGTSCYLKVYNKVSSTTAQKNCELIGSKLVSANDQAEMDFLLFLGADILITGGDIWVFININIS